MSQFGITAQKGFHITFENGWTVSVQFGRGNYCENYDHSDWQGPVPPSKDAEVAAWDFEGEWFVFEDGNTVKGNVTPFDLLVFMNMVATK